MTGVTGVTGRRRRRRVSTGRSVLASVVAGTAGTLALEAVSYLDMLARGRPASQVPGTLATRIADAVGVDLGGPAGNRASALGALLGNLTGVSVAVGYGLARHTSRLRPGPPAGLVVAAAAMAAGDAPAILAGVTNPVRWGVAGWLADIVPHAVYGITTVAVYEALIGRSR